MGAIDELLARLTDGGTVSADEYAQAKAADELDAIRADNHQLIEQERERFRRHDQAVAEMHANLAAVDAATDLAEQRYHQFMAAHAALCTAVDEMSALALAARSHINRHLLHPASEGAAGRGAFDIDALGASVVQVANVDGGRLDVRWPINGPYFTWVRNRRAEGQALDGGADRAD